ncbi:hypothetical protein ILYODFUR_015650 [Ilyodon furcidens]|uniref:Uncharacterized protein n=1 Tax=Ilyodon furcidens TaxID=33524 RepID=A0ABV0UV83_9TELE
MQCPLLLASISPPPPQSEEDDQTGQEEAKGKNLSPWCQSSTPLTRSFCARLLEAPVERPRKKKITVCFGWKVKSVFTLLLGPFTFFSAQKTKYLQILTSLMRWIGSTGHQKLDWTVTLGATGENKPSIQDLLLKSQHRTVPALPHRNNRAASIHCPLFVWLDSGRVLAAPFTLHALSN